MPFESKSSKPNKKTQNLNGEVLQKVIFLPEFIAIVFLHIIHFLNLFRRKKFPELIIIPVSYTHLHHDSEPK